MEQNEIVLTPRQQFVANLKERILSSLSNGQLSTAFTTASCAPAYGWSREEYALMPVVANELRAEGYVVSSAVNHEVTDWTIINK